jgi:predicted TIM-barrel fold metal-dependent hydrolase
MKIDIFTHVVPKKYKKVLGKVDPNIENRIARVPALYDLDQRFQIMDRYEHLTQVLTLSLSGALVLENPKVAVEFAKLANDEMAEMINKYPERFISGAASLPMTDIDAAIEELDRAVRELKLKGLQLFTPTKDTSLDSPEFMPLFQKMHEYGLPIWIHPKRLISYADYKTKKESNYYIYHVFGWPYETTVAMTHLVFSGIFDRFPGIKIITHHCGAMVPFFEQRIAEAYSASDVIHGEEYKDKLSKPPIEYFKMFYGDTVLSGSTNGLRCGHSFFGADHLLFGTDMPYDSELGNRTIRKTMYSIEQLNISNSEKEMIYEGNARRLLNL